MKVPKEFKKNVGSLMMLADWYEKELPDSIQMTLAQENWYRMLFPPFESFQSKTMLFRGIPIEIYETTEL